MYDFRSGLYWVSSAGAGRGSEMERISSFDTFSWTISSCRFVTRRIAEYEHYRIHFCLLLRFYR
jgi:hypothetical protein